MFKKFKGENCVLWCGLIVALGLALQPASGSPMVRMVHTEGNPSDWGLANFTKPAATTERWGD